MQANASPDDLYVIGQENRKEFMELSERLVDCLRTFPASTANTVITVLVTAPKEFESSCSSHHKAV